MPIPKPPYNAAAPHVRPRPVAIAAPKAIRPDRMHIHSPGNAPKTAKLDKSRPVSQAMKDVTAEALARAKAARSPILPGPDAKSPASSEATPAPVKPADPTSTGSSPTPKTDPAGEGLPNALRDNPAKPAR